MDKKVKVVCLDDDNSVLKALSRLLRSHQIDCNSFTNPTKCLCFLRHNTVDVIISDYRMPEINGVDFLLLARIIAPSTPRIILSAFTDPDGLIRAINSAGVFRYLTKPWDDKVIMSVIHNAAKLHNSYLDLKSLIADDSNSKDSVIEIQSVIDKLERETPGISRIKRDRDGYIIL
ncbi:response regulator [Marinobacter sp. NSM]|uniref:response regulator n=1 Tax=Marinobacter sp. NSM TaxID=3458004 RepID=UPI0040371FD8